MDTCIARWTSVIGRRCAICCRVSGQASSCTPPRNHRMIAQHRFHVRISTSTRWAHYLDEKEKRYDSRMGAMALMKGCRPTTACIRCLGRQRLRQMSCVRSLDVTSNMPIGIFRCGCLTGPQHCGRVARLSGVYCFVRRDQARVSAILREAARGRGLQSRRRTRQQHVDP